MKTALLSLLLVTYLLVSSSASKPLFEVHVSTRHILCLDGQRAGTSGGLRPLRGGAVDHPGTAVRALCGEWVASDGGLYRGAVKIDDQPTASLCQTDLGLASGHRQGEVKLQGRGFQVPSSAPVTALAWSEGKLWAGTSEGLWTLTPDGKVEAQQLSREPASQPVTALLSTPQGLLVGTPAGVFQHRHNDWSLLPGSASQSLQEITALAQGPDQQVWIGTSSRGVFHGVPGQGLDALLDSPTEISALAWGSNGLLMGTPDGVYDSSGRIDRNQEVADNHITALAVVAGRLWVGTFQRGLCSLDDKGWHCETELPSDWVNHLGSQDQAALVRLSDGSVYRRQNESWKLLDKHDGLLKGWTSCLGHNWVGTFGGYSLATPASAGWRSQAPKPALKGVTVTCLTQHAGEVWLGSQSGLFRTRPGKPAVQVLDPLSDSWVTALASHSGDLWAGTFRGGLCRLQQGRWSRVAPHIERVHCLLSTPNGLWIGTPKGLVFSDGKRWHTFDRSHGLPGDSVWALEVDGEDLWVGTDSGLARASTELLTACVAAK